MVQQQVKTANSESVTMDSFGFCPDVKEAGTAGETPLLTEFQILMQKMEQIELRVRDPTKSGSSGDKKIKLLICADVGK